MRLSLLLYPFLFLAGAALGQEPPPRSAQDLLRQLAEVKPDPAAAALARAELDTPLPPDGSPLDLGRVYLKRADAASRLGMLSRQIAELRAGMEASRGSEVHEDIVADLGSAEGTAGNLLNAIRLREALVDTTSKGGRRLAVATVLARAHAELGDEVATARAIERMDKVFDDLRRSRAWAWNRHFWTRQMEFTRGALAMKAGRYPEAEQALRRAVEAMEADRPLQAKRQANGFGGPSDDAWLRLEETTLDRLDHAILRQGRLTEAEIIARQVFAKTLARTGRSSPGTAAALRSLAQTYNAQGRDEEAVALARESVKSYLEAGAPPESLSLAGARRTLAHALVARERWADALAEFDLLAQAAKIEPALAARLGAGDAAWGLALIQAGRAAEAVALLRAEIPPALARYGPGHYLVAELRGHLALALAATGQLEAAYEQMSRAITVLLARARNADDPLPPAAQRRLARLLEGWIKLLWDLRDSPLRSGTDLAAETFRVADAARGQRVARAISASAARAAADTPELADLVREDQDTRAQLAAQYELLADLVSAPPEQRAPRAAEEARTRIETLKARLPVLKERLERGFPRYAELVNPRPATVDQARDALRPGEVLVAFLTGDSRTWVWAIPKEGAPRMTMAPLGEARLNEMVTALRRGLDPAALAQGRFAAFDLDLAHELYAALLAPLKESWAGAATLITVPHGPLAELPLGLLPTAPARAAEGGALFAGFRDLPWLARSVALAQVPSAATLVTLRQLPPPKAGRRAFAGFGDPLFAPAAQAAAPGQVRGVKLTVRALTRSADALGQLPPLPDTGPEIETLARTLGAEAERDVYLHARANEKLVKSTPLADRRVVAFATHGLVPGELPGLSQPALALSAPGLAGVDGDGLLTLDEVLGLKLDADWVVLSACNSGSGAGGEALSGLGRGFFYAGSRALLVSNWSVESRSARLLTTELFQRQAADPKLTRAQALRQAMLALMDAGVDDPSGERLLSYAHPMFWAAFSLVGDGG